MPVSEFVDLLNFAQVVLVVDVRTIPRSRANPQYNFDILPNSLSQFQIGYEHIAELGGLRGKKQVISPILNAFWKNQSFHIDGILKIELLKHARGEASAANAAALNLTARRLERLIDNRRSVLTSHVAQSSIAKTHDRARFK